MTTTRNTHELRAIVALLDTMSSETMCAADDATLQNLNLCATTGRSWARLNWRYARGPSEAMEGLQAMERLLTARVEK
jgi:hypothetical protein